MKATIQKAVALYKNTCGKAYTLATTGIARHATALALLAGICVLTIGLSDASYAAPGTGVDAGDQRISEVSCRMFDLIEGNFGSLIMIAAGLGAIISAAFGAYRAAVGLLVVAVGAFILRSLVDIFFDFTSGECDSIRNDNGGAETEA